MSENGWKMIKVVVMHCEKCSINFDITLGNGEICHEMYVNVEEGKYGYICLRCGKQTVGQLAVLEGAGKGRGNGDGSASR